MLFIDDDLARQLPSQGMAALPAGFCGDALDVLALTGLPPRMLIRTVLVHHLVGCDVELAFVADAVERAARKVPKANLRCVMALRVFRRFIDGKAGKVDLQRARQSLEGARGYVEPAVHAALGPFPIAGSELAAKLVARVTGCEVDEEFRWQVRRLAALIEEMEK